MKRARQGFTIVELLIVVVVIAILAAIIIVSYNGITNQAKDAEILSRVDAHTKILKMYKAQNGSFPLVNATETGSANNACLGSPGEYPAVGPYAAGACTTSTAIKTSASLNSALQPFAGTLPKGSIESLTSGTDNQRGLFYFTPGGTGTTVQIQYSLKGEGRKCGRGNPISFNGLTICIVDID